MTREFRVDVSPVSGPSFSACLQRAVGYVYFTLSLLQPQCHIEGGAVFGEDVTLKSGLVCIGAKVLPNKTLDKCYLEPTVIM